MLSVASAIQKWFAVQHLSDACIGIKSSHGPTRQQHSSNLDHLYELEKRVMRTPRPHEYESVEWKSELDDIVLLCQNFLFLITDSITT